MQEIRLIKISPENIQLSESQIFQFLRAQGSHLDFALNSLQVVLSVTAVASGWVLIEPDGVSLRYFTRDPRARTCSHSPRAWRPDFPGAAREAP